MSITDYPKRLIEVDLPIKRISAHARREKSIRHGHISTLHIWWARRPLAACRAVICASLWPDPADPLCPPSFKEKACSLMREWAKDNLGLLGAESYSRFVRIQKEPSILNDDEELRSALLDFIADFANWDNSTNEEYLQTSRALTQTAHDALGGVPGSKPLVVDPFAGGGSIPLEALRVGADAFASDLNPIAVLLNKVILEYIPKYGEKLADEVRKWGEWTDKKAEKELAKFYPKDADGSTPIAYLWARTIECEGPGCGASIPLLKSVWLAKKNNRLVALNFVPKPDQNLIDIDIIEKENGTWVNTNDRNITIKKPSLDVTVRRGSVTCPCCGYSTSVVSVRRQLNERKGGTSDSIMYCKVVKDCTGKTKYLKPKQTDIEAINKSVKALNELINKFGDEREIISSFPLPPDGALGFSVQKYGVIKWIDLFTYRQRLMLLTYVSLINNLPMTKSNPELNTAVKILLGLTLSKISSFSSSLCIWRNVRSCVAQTFGRPTLSMVWDFGEMNPFFGSAGSFKEAMTYLKLFMKHNTSFSNYQGQSLESDADKLVLPDDIADIYFTDPPYYDAIPYSHLSEFFLLWLQIMGLINNNTLSSIKKEECIADERLGKNRKFFENKITSCLLEGQRITKSSNIGVIVFAHKSTAGWETMLQAMIDAGWIVTASWPIDTERPGRLRAQKSAALSSSVHLVCRPRKNPDGSLRTDEVGDWRDVLQELPGRIHAWMPRLAADGVVGADAIFACLGPALEIFSRYNRVEKASGEEVTLREYLEHVWAAVAREALSMIFEGADATGFEEDARLTAMWLWTLCAGRNGNGNGKNDADEDDSSAKKQGGAGYGLEYDAARKIAQGLGAHLEKLTATIEVKGDQARLLSVAERTRFLFGKEESAAPTRQKKKQNQQMNLLEMLEDGEAETGDAGWGEKRAPDAGKTILDRLHQSMILFAAGRGEALKRFLVEEGVGQDLRFWSLAQALSALYPPSSDEKRWVDGVLARKKGLGF